MRLSEIKTQVTAASARSTEAFAEIGTRIAAMQTQIDELLSGNTDPEVTDAAFAADLATLKANIDQLADIVPAKIVVENVGQQHTGGVPPTPTPFAKPTP